MELLATSSASSLTPPFPASFAPDTHESLTLCQHSTHILSWGRCACCLLCLGYLSFICFLEFVTSFNYSNAASSETLSPYCIHPLYCAFFLFAFITSCICLLTMCLYSTSRSFYNPPQWQGFFSYLCLQNLVQCTPWTVSKYLLKERVNGLYNVAAFVSYVTGC